METKIFNLKWRFSLIVTFFILGLLLSLQFKTQQEFLNSLSAQPQENLVRLWRELNTKKEGLAAEIAKLETTKREIATQGQTGKDLLESLQKEKETLQLLTGTSQAKGPGIKITITGEAPLIYLDLIDLVNELWATGAEAIAINDQRITLFTPISEATDVNGTSYITIGEEKLLYPCVVWAIGDPHTLEGGLSFAGGLLENLRLLYGIYPEITKEKEIILPAAKYFPR